jgi:hypothetical protein
MDVRRANNLREDDIRVMHHNHSSEVVKDNEEHNAPYPLDLFREFRRVDCFKIARNANVLLETPQPLGVVCWCLIPRIVA